MPGFRESWGRFWNPGLPELPAPPDPFELEYDFDYVPPPPRPGMMRAPFAGEPHVKKKVLLKLTDTKDYEGQTGIRYVQCRLCTEDGMDIVYLMVSPRAHIMWANRIVEAFCPALGGIRRKGVIEAEDVHEWKGRSIIADLKYETWDPDGSGVQWRGAWRVHDLYPVDYKF